MRRSSTGRLGILLAGAVLAGVLWQGSEYSAGQTPPKAAPAAAPAAAGARGPNERFYTVQHVLDQGGSFYFYADAKDTLKKFVQSVVAASGNPQIPPEVPMVAAMANQAIDNLGLYGIQDFGVSTVPDGAVNRTKVFIGAPEGRAKGILKVLGGDPHPMKMVERVPADTLVLLDGDFDVQALWGLVRQMVQDIGGAAGVAQLDQLLAQFTAETGVDVAATVPTLGSEIAFVMGQNPAEKLTIPVPGQPLSFDSPRVALLVRLAKDDLYQTLKQTLSKHGAIGAETTDGKLRFVAINTSANPFWQVSPVLGTDGEYLYLASHVDYLKTLTTASGPGLGGAEEYKALATGLPTEANACFFVSKRLQQMMQDVRKSVAGDMADFPDAAGVSPAGLPQGPGAPPMRRMRPEQMMPILLTSLASELEKQQGPPAGALTLRINRPDGVLVVSRSTGSAAQYMPALLVAPAGVLAAIAIPNFLETQVRAKVMRVQSDTRSLATAIEAFMVDMNKYPPSSANTADNLFGPLVQKYPTLKGQSTFQLVDFKSLSAPARAPGVPAGQAGPLVMPLTSPIAYIASIPRDPFGPGDDVPLCYFSPADGKKWLVWSAGPNGSYEITTEDLARVFAPGAPDSQGALLTGTNSAGKAYTFDATNGTKSVGDVWRIGGNVAAPAPPAAPPIVGLPGR